MKVLLIAKVDLEMSIFCKLFLGRIVFFGGFRVYNKFNTVIYPNLTAR